MIRAFAALSCIAALAAGCQKEEPQAAAPAPPASASAAAPVDHLADGELLEGDAKAFGLVLPRGVSIVHGFDDLRVAEGMVPADKVANYLRQRLRDGKITVGARSTVFEGVRSAGAPDLELSVRVEPAGALQGCRLEIRRLTQEKAPVLPDEESRWRAAGLKPNGQPLDPKTLH